MSWGVGLKPYDLEGSSLHIIGAGRRLDRSLAHRCPLLASPLGGPRKGSTFQKSIPQGNTALEKQAHMVGFLLEVFDDLMIEPKYNVSDSSGMDPFMRGRGPRGASTTESRRLFQ